MLTCVLIIGISVKLFLSHIVCHQVSALMDKFEKQFEDLDVQTTSMENAMSNTTTLTVPQVSYSFIFRAPAESEPTDLFQVFLCTKRRHW